MLVLLHDHVIEYTDIVNFSILKLEFEKLRSVLFTKQQLSLYNLIIKPQNPFRKGELNNLTKVFTFSKNKPEQDVIIENLDFNKLSLLDGRLFDLIE